jgi:hypothetical protein
MIDQNTEWPRAAPAASVAIKKRILANGARVLIVFAALLFAACSEWQYDVTVKGISFGKVKIDERGLVIGILKEDTTIGERSCKQGWVHIYPNGVPAAFTAAKPIELAEFTIPVGTWVTQNHAGVVTVCAFPRDTEVQDHLCRGSGGPKGVQAAFYSSGALKHYFLCRDTKIQSIPCKAGLLDEGVELYENGQLKACKLSERLTRDGQTYKRGTRIQLGPDGQILP